MAGMSPDPAAGATDVALSGTPPPAPAQNVYAHAGAGMLSPKVAGQRSLVYVPNHSDGTVSVIDPATFKVIDTYASGPGSQHVVPSWDLQTLWVNNDEGGYTLTAIDPRTGKRRGPNVPVGDPYNMYFTPDGRSAIVVAEAERRLDFRDPQTMALQGSIPVACDGINHADYSPDLTYAVFTCEFSGQLVKIDWRNRRVLGYLQLNNNPQLKPQDIRLAPDGKHFFVADMVSNGVFVIDASGPQMRQVNFIPTGPMAHGIYPSRDGRFLYVSNRDDMDADHHLGSVSVVDPVRQKVVATWPIPGGGSPDMGDVSADGKQLWLSGRYNNEVYVLDTTDGHLLAKIPVGREPHGLAVWPQPGRFSLGHTGNTR
jgi:YVTN family beta-propeller protein